MLAQTVQAQVKVAEEVAGAEQAKGLAKILVTLMKSNPSITPFHLQTLMNKRDVEKLRDDAPFIEHLEMILAEARVRPDLEAGAQALLKVGSAASVSASRKVRKCGLSLSSDGL